MNTLLEQPHATAQPPKTKPRLAFLGTGWIGRNRMEAVAASGLGEIAAIVEPSLEMMEPALKAAPEAAPFKHLEELNVSELDGLVIATPSALHAEQSIWALEGGLAVFCQKPLARTRAEHAQVVTAARRANRLLRVDLSYRELTAAKLVWDAIQSGELGDIFAVEMVFHNAYGPDKPWFYDPKLSGGGCVMDLGIHLVDLALWWLGFPKARTVSARLFRDGQPLGRGANIVEDFGTARIDLDNGLAVKIDCSWKLNAGCDAIISGTVYGSKGGAAFRNVDGSFYNFVGELYRGTKREVVAQPPDPWGGRAVVNWVRELSESPEFRPDIENLVDVAGVLDRIYQREELA
jgi:predicted dehydrogenase